MESSVLWWGTTREYDVP
ncbi:hypothetical protein AYI69_g5411, partial [Smittium culicis]